MARKKQERGGGTFDDFVAELETVKPPKKFEPFAWYNAQGDSLEIYLSADHHVSERVNGLFTVFVAADDRDRVVGLAIKNIQQHFGENVKEILVNVGRATINLLVHGALTGVEIHRLKKQRSKAATASSAASKPKPSDRMQAVLNYFGEIGETEVAIRNAEELQLV